MGAGGWGREGGGEDVCDFGCGGADGDEVVGCGEVGGGLGVRYVSAVFAWIEVVNLRADDARVNTRALEQVIYDRPAGLEGNVLRVRPKL